MYSDEKAADDSDRDFAETDAAGFGQKDLLLAAAAQRDSVPAADKAAPMPAEFR